MARAHAMACVAQAEQGIAALARAMQEDPNTMQQLQKLMSDPSVARMMAQMQGSQGGGSPADRMKGVADWMAAHRDQEQLRDMLN